ncbi:MAG TPA: DoxX family protein [Puia sp.]|jgi:putative oxidoreductase|nr:DoxX family protein [Puia sp.]
MKFFSTQSSDGAFNLGVFVLRLFGLLLLLDYGLEKITHFSSLEYTFYNFLHIGHRWSLVLCIFAEVICAAFVTLGIFTRFAALVLVINFSVAAFMALKGEPLGHRELALMYLAVFIALTLMGPGKYSVDGAMGK